MESEARKELENILTKELEKQRKTGYEIGFSHGEQEGMKKALEWIQCELLYTDLLDEQQIMDLFRIDEERIKEIRKIIKTPKWFFSHQTGRITL